MYHFAGKDWYSFNNFILRKIINCCAFYVNFFIQNKLLNLKSYLFVIIE